MVARLFACLLVVLITPSALSQENILPQGDFASASPGSLPAGWAPEQSWMASRLKVQQEGDRSFVHVEESPGAMHATLPVHPDWEALTLTWDARITDFAQGNSQWSVPYVGGVFLDEAGKVVGGQGPKHWYRVSQDWSSQSLALPVPEAATQVRVVVSFKGGEGAAMDVANVQLLTPTGAAPLAQAVAAAPEPAASPAPAAAPQRTATGRQAVQPVDESRIAGASIDESKIDVTIRATPETGLGKAIDQAKQALKQGRSVKVVAAEGLYREGGILIDGNDLGPGKDALFVLEGEGSGAVISGSDVFPASAWTTIEAADGGTIYVHDWTYDFENLAGVWGKYNAKKVLGHRQEMVFLNGQPMKQVLLEQYDYKAPTGWGGTGEHTYTGFVKPEQALTPGTFGVAQRDENGNKIYVYPPKGVDFSAATTEIAVRDNLLWVWFKNNVVIRNVQIQHSNANLRARQSAFRIGRWHDNPTDQLAQKNILIENVRSVHNNAAGMNIGHVENLTLRNVRCEYNGSSGIGLSQVRGLVLEDSSLSYNNWRGHLGGLYGWAVGGIKIHQTWDGRVSRCDFIGNMMPGLWCDIGNGNLVFEDNVVLGNKRGIFIEITPGPVLVRRNISAGDREDGMLVTASLHVTAENNILFGNELRQVGIVSSDRDTANEVGHLFYGQPAKMKLTSGPLKLVRNAIVASEADEALFMQKTGSAKNYQALLKGMLTSEHNLWWSPGAGKAFGFAHAASETGDLRKFQSFTGTAGDAVWAKPGFRDPMNYDFRLEPGSPLEGWELPTKQVDPQRVQAMRDYYAYWGYAGGFSYNDDPE